MTCPRIMPELASVAIVVLSWGGSSRMAMVMVLVARLMAVACSVLEPTMPASACRAIAKQNKILPTYLDEPNLCPEYLHDQIRRLERELRTQTIPFVSALVAKRIEEKQWCRNNREALALLDSRMDHHRLIASIRYEPGKGHFALFSTFTMTH